MEMATITAKGQVTIPKKVRDRLKLEPGMKLAFIDYKDDACIVTPTKNVHYGEISLD
ncbi:MAG: AbrB/MazE/SpoVT family DNA-binding domain-containing protein [Thermoplasmatales archaeon]|jgi:AbrB family looped-hinge helix DNA binding protein|nr:AbrB/MazE/SpoVT family DNA-binding domain-containing protein [Thermoplasmatales archaeon]